MNQALISLAQQNFTRLESWNLDSVKQYLVLKENFDPETVDKMEVEYKRFLALTLAVGQDQPLPVSTNIDPMWHTHLLFSLDYTDMCYKHADGVYIHHLPAVSDEERGRLCMAYKEGTIPLYRAAFGEPDKDFWPPDAQICIACCDRDSKRDDVGQRSLVI